MDFVQFGILSNSGFCVIRDFVRTGFCPIRDFVQVGILSIRDFVQFGILPIRDFVQFGILFFWILSSSGFCPLWTLFIRDFVQFGILPIRDFGHSGFCPIWDFVHSGFCPFGILSNSGFCPIRDFVRTGFCTGSHQAIARFENFALYHDKKRSGRSRKTSSLDDNLIPQIAVCSLTSSCKKIHSVLLFKGTDVRGTTLSRHLVHDFNLKAFKPAKILA